MPGSQFSDVSFATADGLSGDWTAPLEAALLRRLAEEWYSINAIYFGSSLSSPLFRIVDGESFLARWDPETRHIEFSRKHTIERPWPELMETLKHEVAHQFVGEVLKADEAPHGPAFRSTCRRMGISSAATAFSHELGGSGTLQGDGSPRAPHQRESDRTISRVKKLLALAQSPEQHEAEAAATAARKLMMRFNLQDSIGSAEAAAKIELDSDGAQAEGHDVRFLGQPTGRVQEHERRLAAIIGTYYFVEIIWIPVYRPLEGKRGSVLEVCGSPANLEMAAYVYGFLREAAERLWLAHKRDHGITRNRDRLSFLAGVMKGFAGKLAQQDRELQAEGLVWVPNASAQEYHSRRHPFTRTVRHGGRPRNAAFAHGTEAGSELVVSRPMESGSTSDRPKALPRASRG